MSKKKSVEDYVVDVSKAKIKVILNVKDHPIELSVDELRDLHSAIGNLLGVKDHVTYVPYYPYVPTWKWTGPYWYGSTTTLTDGNTSYTLTSSVGS